MLSLLLLGSFEARIGERPLIHFGTKKAQALLIYLAVQNQHVHQREALMSLFWPDSPLKAAQQNLRQTLYQLQKALQPEVTDFPLILSERYTIRVNPEVPLAVDVAQFEVLSASPCKPSDWQTAVSLYRGEFLADFFLPDCDPFEEWASGKRAFLHRRMQEVLHSLGTHYLRIGDLAAAETAVRRQLALDNLQESAHRQLLKILAENGRRQEALSHYETLRYLLHDELAIEPEPETISLIEAIRTGGLKKTAAVSPCHPAPQNNEAALPGHNLPQLLTSFIGREQELEAISELIAQNRFVTLTGVGGIGKTTLSIQIGHQLLQAFPDGIWFIELAPIADPALVAQTVAYTLGLWESSNQPILETLLNFLKGKTSLLILDNCEHVIEAAALFAQISLETCPGLKILTTSREICDIGGETAFIVPPLSTPENHQLPLLYQWQQYEAMCLFAERAATALPSFRVTQDNMAPLAQICQQLDGIPLALELAAARVKILTTAQIADRLDDRFRLLTDGSRAAAPRHQTLRALVDWSWDLLSDAEQNLLQRLSVFAGGMSLEAVEAVCAGDGLVAHDLLDLLTALVNKSLVIAQRKQGQETRFRLLETIRQYAHERLVTAVQEEKFRTRHLAYYLLLAEQAEQKLVGPEQATWMKRLERELDNVRAALVWARDTDIETGLRITAALWQFWDHGYVREGKAWLAQLLALANSVAPIIKAKALWIYGRINYYLLNSDLAQESIEASIALNREIGNLNGIALGLLMQGVMAVDERIREKHLLESLRLFQASGDKIGEAETLQHLACSEEDHEQALLYLKESEALYRELGHLAGIAEVIRIFGRVVMLQGDFDFESMRLRLEEGQAIEESLGRRGSSASLQILGMMYFRVGQYQQALAYLEKSIAISQQTGDKMHNYWSFVHSGYALLRMGEVVQARDVFLKSLMQFKEANIVSGVVFSVEGLASLATRLGQVDRAVQLFAWADATRQIIHDRRPLAEQADVECDMVVLQEKVGKEAAAAAYAAGKLMTMEQVIASELPLEFAYS